MDIACIGAGTIGRSWAIVFARAGFEVRLFDSNASVLATAGTRIRESLPDFEANGLLVSTLTGN